jgi:beta-barrel assembly-enhancing protease
MFFNNLRKFSASILLIAISFGCMILPTNVLGQTNDAETAKKDKKDKKKKTVVTPAPTPATPALSGKALAENEDPSQIGKRNINKGTDKFFGWLGGSRDKEAAIGRQISAQVEQEVKLNEDPIITEYINRVGQNLVLHSDAKSPFTIKVINSDEINAFALPGGYFYVNTGLILAADNESELAGVMSHEIAHVCARHAMENSGKGQLINVGLLGAIIFSGGIASTVLQNAGGIIGALAGTKFSRGAEGEADRLGVQYMYAAGYDPTGMATMFEKLASQNKKKPGKLAKLFSTHPQSIERRDSSISLAGRFPEKEEYVISSSEFQKVKARLLRLTNAKASTQSDIDDIDSGKPTLKRRQPEGESTTPGDSSSNPDVEKEAPKLKRKDAEPSPSPTPER